MENTKRSIFPFYLVFLFFLGVFFIPLHSVEEKTQEISFQDYKIHNRILAKVEGKPISVIDVMKQMNVYIAEFFPELLQSPEQRYQFYMAHWKTTLQKMIATELIMADAKSRNFKVADGDVREGIQRKFGPNVIQKLDQLGISYEEAKAIVYQENIRKTMEWFRVISKAVHRVGIKEIQQEYKKRYAPKETYTYQILTLKPGENGEVQHIKELLSSLEGQGCLSLEEIKEHVEQKVFSPSTTLSISPIYEQEAQKISQQHKTILASLSSGQVSAPIEVPGKTHIRLFQCLKHEKKEPPLLEEILNSLKEELIQRQIEEQMQIYESRLHARFGYHDMMKELPVDFQPFERKTR